MKVLGRLLGYARRYWLALAAGVAAMGAGLVAALIVPYIIRVVIDRAIVGGDVRLLGWAASAVIGVSLIRGVFAFGERYAMEYLAQKVIYDLRNALYSHLQRLSFSFYDHAQTGQLMSRVTGDVETLRRFLGFGLMNLVSNGLTMLAVLAVLVSLHWRLTVLSLATLPFTVLAIARFSREIRPAYTAIQQQLAVITSRLQENLSGVRVVRAFAREEDEEARFHRENTAYLERTVAAARLWAFFFPLMNFITGAGTALVIWYGGREVILGRLSLGSLVAFNSFLLMLIMPLRMIGWIVNLSQRAQAAGQRIFEILDTEPDVRDLPGARPLPRVRGEVVFENVSFTYEPRGAEGDDFFTVHDINLRVRPGETVAVLGATGSGKSTLVNLIPRFYDPTAGRVLIDGVDIREVTLESLRRQIGVVLQDTFLFSASIRENIAYGRPGATLEEIQEAARAAGIHDFITGLPQGYDTLVGERGVGLSGGERQRVAIARALLMDPRILILDDSTSSVDTETEHAIQAALRRLMVGRTTFVIAQRLATLKSADRIVVLEEGRIVDEGDHAALLSRSRIYREIYGLQFRPQEDAGREGS